MDIGWKIQGDQRELQRDADEVIQRDTERSGSPDLEEQREEVRRCRGVTGRFGGDAAQDI
jgi:hypothetical protein